jgi:hypothetical protein
MRRKSGEAVYCKECDACKATSDGKHYFCSLAGEVFYNNKLGGGFYMFPIISPENLCGGEKDEVHFNA